MPRRSGAPKNLLLLSALEHARRWLVGLVSRGSAGSGMCMGHLLAVHLLVLGCGSHKGQAELQHTADTLPSPDRDSIESPVNEQINHNPAGEDAPAVTFPTMVGYPKCNNIN